jgi:hypothetical protein
MVLVLVYEFLEFLCGKNLSGLIREICEIRGSIPLGCGSAPSAFSLRSVQFPILPSAFCIFLTPS